MNVMRTFQTLVAVVATTAPISAVSAQDVSLGFDGLIGQVNDRSVQTGRDTDTIAAGLPSIQLGGDSFVGQADGLIASQRGDTAYGGALHLGTRLGGISYIGLYGSASELRRNGGLSTYRVGGEVNFDLGSVGLSSVAGYEDTEAASFLVQTTATDNVFDVYNGKGRIFAFTDLSFRPSESFRVSVGHRYTGGNHAAAASVGIGISHNVSLMAEGRLGEGDYKAGLLGIRVRFGGDGNGSKLLENRLIEDLFAPSSTRRTLLTPLPPPPPPPGCTGNGCCGGYL